MIPIIYAPMAKVIGDGLDSEAASYCSKKSMNFNQLNPVLTAFRASQEHDEVAAAAVEPP